MFYSKAYLERKTKRNDMNREQYLHHLVQVYEGEDEEKDINGRDSLVTPQIKQQN